METVRRKRKIILKINKDHILKHTLMRAAENIKQVFVRGEVILHPIQSFSHITSLFSLLYCYFHGTCSNKRHSLIPIAQSFAAKTHLVISKGLNQHHSLYIILVRRMFNSENCYFVKLTHMWRFPQTLQF